MNEKKVSIVLLDSFPVPSVKGGAIETLMDSFLSINEKERKVNVDFYSIYDKEAEKQSSIYKYNSIHYIKINKYSKLVYKILRKLCKPFTKLPYNFYYYKVLKMMKKQKYDLIIFEGGPLEGWGLDKYRVIAPTCFHLHFHGVPEKPVEVYDSLIAVSQFVADKWKDVSPGQKICVAPNGVDVERFLNCKTDKNELRRKLNIKENDFVILYVGRIIEVKGIYELICSLESTNSDIKLVVIGSSNFAEKTRTEYEKKVEEKIKELNGRVVFTGYIPNSHLQDYYRIADIQVIPSKWEEAAGLVAIEGMASGLPIIATKSGGMVEYIDSECSYIIDKENNLENNLREAILYMYNNPSVRKRMSDHGKERALLFSQQEFYNSMIESIEKITSNLGEK